MGSEPRNDVWSFSKCRKVYACEFGGGRLQGIAGSRGIVQLENATMGVHEFELNWNELKLNWIELFAHLFKFYTIFTPKSHFQTHPGPQSVLTGSNLQHPEAKMAWPYLCFLDPIKALRSDHRKIVVVPNSALDPVFLISEPLLIKHRWTSWNGGICMGSIIFLLTTPIPYDLTESRPTRPGMVS